METAEASGASVAGAGALFSYFETKLIFNRYGGECPHCDVSKA
jgi:hypothetical protein